MDDTAKQMQDDDLGLDSMTNQRLIDIKLQIERILHYRSEAFVHGQEDNPNA